MANNNLIKPGPWTNICPVIKIKAVLRLNISFFSSLGSYLGIYRGIENWKEKGTYPIVFNLTASNLTKLVEKHGLDQVLAAAEKSLSALKDSSGKSRYGKIVILKVLSDHSSNSKKQFISCVAKTTKKHIKGFVDTRRNKLIVTG